MMKLDIAKEVSAAEARIRSYIRETPLEYAAYLSRLTGSHVYLKLENMQLTGSFKYRGAVNRLLSLTPEEKEKGIITASSGNHAAAFTYASQQLGCKGKLYLPVNISPAKLEAIQLYGQGRGDAGSVGGAGRAGSAGEIVFYGTDVSDSENAARQEAAQVGALYISAYNDIKIIGGQGTAAVELERQLDSFDAVFVPVGGGGLMSGMAGYLKERRPASHIQMIGCQPQHSPVMLESIKAGRIIEMESKPTLADGSAGGIEAGSITFDICRAYVDDFVVVGEDQIAAAIVLCLEKQHLLIEGAAAMTIAAFLATSENYWRKTVVLLISGRRIALDTLRQVLK